MTGIKMDNKQKKIPKTLGFRLLPEDESLYRKIKKLAKKKDRSLSYVIKEILKSIELE